MAKAVVNGFEMIQVEEQQTEWFLLRLLERKVK